MAPSPGMGLCFFPSHNGKGPRQVRGPGIWRCVRGFPLILQVSAQSQRGSIVGLGLPNIKPLLLFFATHRKRERYISSYLRVAFLLVGSLPPLQSANSSTGGIE